MRLRVRTDRWTTMFFTALGLGPLSACGGATTPGVPGSGGVGGAGGSAAFPCNDPQPVVNPKSGYESCANGSIHRPVKSMCPTTVPRPDFMAPDAGFNSCTRDSDCPGPYGYCTTGGQIAGYFCLRGCVQDTDCMAGQIVCAASPSGGASRPRAPSTPIAVRVSCAPRTTRLPDARSRLSDARLRMISVEATAIVRRPRRARSREGAAPAARSGAPTAGRS